MVGYFREGKMERTMDELVNGRFYWIEYFDELTVARFIVTEYGERYLLRIGVDFYGAIEESSKEWERGYCRVIAEAKPPVVVQSQPEPQSHAAHTGTI
jgi:hypothetical protein